MNSERKIIDDVNVFGWHIINVFEGDGNPQFSYTIGLTKSFGSPELFISGLNGSTAAVILNMISNEIKSGKNIETQIECGDFFNDYKCYFDFVDKSYYEKYFGRAIWYYKGYDFLALQCVWPNKDHLFPWQTEMPFSQQVLFNM